jgi:hypothetical protein
MAIFMRWGTCVSCEKENVAPDEMPRYDVLADGSGPYCEPCFASTKTGKHIAKIETETNDV